MVSGLPANIASAALASYLRCSGESPEAAPVPAPSTARTDFTASAVGSCSSLLRSSSSASNISSADFWPATAAEASWFRNHSQALFRHHSQALIARTHHHLPPAVIASSPHLPPALIASPLAPQLQPLRVVGARPLRQQMLLGSQPVVRPTATTSENGKNHYVGSLLPTGAALRPELLFS